MDVDYTGPIERVAKMLVGAGLARPDEAAEAVASATLAMLEKGHELPTDDDTRLLWGFAKREVLHARKQARREGRWMADYLRTQGSYVEHERESGMHQVCLDGTGESFLVEVDRCRVRRHRTGYGRGYWRLPEVPCVVCSTPFPHRLSKTKPGERQETCSKSCAAKLRHQRRREAGLGRSGSLKEAA